MCPFLYISTEPLYTFATHLSMSLPFPTYVVVISHLSAPASLNKCGLGAGLSLFSPAPTPTPHACSSFRRHGLEARVRAKHERPRGRQKSRQHERIYWDLGGTDLLGSRWREDHLDEHCERIIIMK
jgi:hypothetical protein